MGKLSTISKECWNAECDKCENCNHICHKGPKSMPRVISEDKWFQIQEDARMDEAA